MPDMSTGNASPAPMVAGIWVLSINPSWKGDSVQERLPGQVSRKTNTSDNLIGQLIP